MSEKRMEAEGKRSPWWWVPSIYYAEGIPYVVVMLVSVIMYKRLGISNAEIALYTSWLYLPWVIKPLWSPLVDILRTKRFWIIVMQLIIGAALGGVALTIPADNFFKITLGFFWLLAFSSATHDIAADGFYMIGLNKHEQAWFVGIRSTFYRLAMITGQGLLIILAGFLESSTGLPKVILPVETTPSAVVSIANPQDYTFEAVDGKLQIVASSDKLIISTATQPKSYSDSVIAVAKAWNLQHGFTEELKVLTQAEKEAQDAKAGLWSRLMAQPLEKVLRKYFGQEAPVISQDFAGNVGVIFFHLNKAPEAEKPVVANFGRSGGDKSISLVEGMRFTFTKDNWNIPAMAVIQLDPKLKVATAAEYSAISGNIPLAWSITFFVIAGLFIFFFIYHKFTLPQVEKEGNAAEISRFFKEFLDTFVLFFKKEKIGLAIAFLLLYRLGESQLVKLASPFLLDAQEAGGLGLTTGQVGFVYGTVGILMLTLGGILGGIVAARNGLKYWIWWMAIAINLPNTVYIYLSQAQPDSFFIINLCVGIEQFGYGFGFTAYMLYMIAVADGKYKTAHFAIATAFMALGMMIPGMVSGWIQEIVGYQHFFIWVLLATIPGFTLIKFLPIDPEFGKKEKA